jgi:hypothetical protein
MAKIMIWPELLTNICRICAAGAVLAFLKP